MKVILKYKKLAKPRGSWWYGVRWGFVARYSEQEMAALNPTWSFEVPSDGKLKCSSSPKGQFYPSSIAFMIRPNTPVPNDHNEPWYFPTAEARAQFIALLHKMRDQAVQAHVDWWKANAPEEGDDERVHLVLCDGEKIDKLEGDAALAADRLV